MNMNEYQKKAKKTAIYPEEINVFYPAFGLAGEAGEICNKLKKVLRGDEIPMQKTKGDLEKELGDVLWYVANLASDLDLALDDVASKNIDKLQDRQDRNVLKGDGDDR
tara:strand:- start:4082 stop:4405 length:324 start_codon:yes stop_codon:yes gene_type:complete